MKNLLVIFIILFSIGIATAQKTKFGIKGGLNIANQTFGGSVANPTPSSIIGYTIGALIEIKLSDEIALQPEVLYSTQGSKFNLNVPFEDGLINADTKISMGYINIPIMLKYYAVEEFCLEFGPQIGILSSADLTVSVLGRSATQDAKKVFNSTDIGLNFGASYNINSNLFIQGRYNLGLTNIAKTEAGDNSKTKNSVFSFSLGYKFN